MTTIIALEHEHGVTLGFDSKVSTGYTSTEVEASKVFVNNGIIFGVAGAVLDAQIMRYADLPNLDEAGWDVDRWVTNTLIPKLVEVLDARHATEYRNNQVATESHALIVVRGRVYELFGDTCWVRRTDATYAIGSGAQFARGALDAGASPYRALQIAEEHDKGTGDTLRVVEAGDLL